MHNCLLDIETLGTKPGDAAFQVACQRGALRDAFR